jgi:hypothetical protein
VRAFLIAAFLACALAKPGVAIEAPELAIVLENSLPEPLVLLISGWTSQTPHLTAYANSLPVSAELSGISSSGAQWDATVRYTLAEGQGEAHLQLAIRGATALGDFDGVFRNAQFHGAVEAGLSYVREGMMLWIPDPSRPVRAVLLWRDTASHAALHDDLQAFGAANNVAVIGLDPSVSEEDALSALGGMSGHREIETVPILLRGRSFVGPAMRRVIAYADAKGGGERDLTPHDWSFELPGDLASLPLVLLHFQHTLDERLSGSRILPVDQTRMWLADNSTWTSGVTKILPAAAFRGDARRMSRLIDKDVAWIYRGAVTRDSPLRLTLAGSHAAQYFPGEPVVLDCFGINRAEWKSVGLYDGAKHIAAVTGNQAVTLATAQKEGVHAGVLVGERADGTLRTSAPVVWVVRPALN